MDVIGSEGLAGIRLLILMAQADGKLSSDERHVLEDALAGVALPGDLTIECLLDEQNDPVLLAQQIKSLEARDYAYASVYAMAWADRELAESEKLLLATLRGAWGIRPGEEEALKEALRQSHSQQGVAAPGQKIADEKTRADAFDKLLTRYCVLTGLTGAIPVPLVPDLMVVPIQIKMVYDIAGLFGQKADRNTVQLMFETLGVGTGARLGISFLSKFIPGWGSVVGAATSFATTYALGKVACIYFEKEGKASMAELKDIFEQERERGKAEYQKQKAALDEAQKTHEKELRELAFELQSRKITPEEYQRRVDSLK